MVPVDDVTDVGWTGVMHGFEGHRVDLITDSVLEAASGGISFQNRANVVMTTFTRYDSCRTILHRCRRSMSFAGRP